LKNNHAKSQRGRDVPERSRSDRLIESEYAVPDMNLWNRKLLAYLHDPPSKPFNVVEHRAIAWSLIEAAFPGISRGDAEWFFDKVCDHTAAAADRVVCPKPSALRAEFKGDANSPFHHPLGGGKLIFENAVPSAEFAEGIVQQAQAFVTNVDALPAAQQDRARFFLHWRLWPQKTAEQDGRALHLPADTRIPDHTIWTHCSLVSALQACVRFEKRGDAVENREFKPAFLLVQIGPVQEFIAQARSTRDLWSGSYLLSWLVAHGITAVTDEVGPDCVIFPALCGQPLFDFLHKEDLYAPLGVWEEQQPNGGKKRMHAEEHILTPNLPNRFLAVVPAWQAEELAQAAQQKMTVELDEIAKACATWFKDKGHEIPADAMPRWRQQIAQFLTVTWQVYPWQPDVQKAIRDAQALPAARQSAEALAAAHRAAVTGIPKKDLDPRNYRHKSWKEGPVWKSEIIPDADGNPVIDNSGFPWAAHYATTDFYLAARRNTREFDAWAANDDKREGAVKDALSGKEEVIGGETWQEGLVDLPGHHFRNGDRLGAINLIKRVWHRAYLEQKGLKRSPKFDSLPAVAAATFAKKMWPEPQAAEFLHLAHIADKFFENGSDDASVFHLTEWERAIKEDIKRKGGPRSEAITALEAARDALKRLKGKPGRYVAVIALDGDSMGKWVSGTHEKSPRWRGQLAAEAATYFEGEPLLKALLDTQRHLSPSYHLQLSEALANFSLYLASPIVEHFDGQLIYAGGDDVLAMLPAEQALPCARALRMAFCGDPILPNVFPGALADGCQPGFVAIDGDWEGWKRSEKRFLKRGFHLLVPGPNADLSAGIAIGHIHAPLQNLVEAARNAEKRAKDTKKGYGKSAFAISLFKRSGETIQWGAKWDSKAIALTKEFTALSDGDKPTLSAKFSYALARLLRAYAIGNDFTITKKNGFNPFEVFPAEFEHCIKQQGPDAPDTFRQTACDYLKQCENRRLDDFLGPFLTTTFINRGGGE